MRRTYSVEACRYSCVRSRLIITMRRTSELAARTNGVSGNMSASKVHRLFGRDGARLPDIAEASSTCRHALNVRNILRATSGEWRS